MLIGLEASELFMWKLGLLGEYLENRYGRKIGLARHYRQLLNYHLGLFSSLKAVDWNSVRRLVFICKGNICRSAYAEARARMIGLPSSSAGFEATTGLPASESAIRAARSLRLDLSSHRTRSLSSFRFLPGDLLLVMEPAQAEWLQSKALGGDVQVTLLGLWCTHPWPHIEDPLGLSDGYFGTCFSLIDNALANLEKRVSTRAHAPATEVNPEWRKNYSVLVTDAHTLGSLACIRSLGRAGYIVHAASARADALGLRSKFSSASVICPAYNDSSYVSWLRSYVRDRGIQVIIPSEGFLLKIRPAFGEFSSLLPISNSEEIVYAAMSKADQFAAFRSLAGTVSGADHLPPYLLSQNGEPLPDSHVLESLGLPLYVKVDECYSLHDKGGGVYFSASAGEASKLLQFLVPDFRKALVEGHVQGRGIGVFFLMWNGELLAEFMHRRIHEVPHTGGASSYRESWWHQAIRDDALLKLKAMKWQGVAMMEYRWNADDDQFYFMEMNARFWGSLHLALFAGLDFPRMLVDAFLGYPPQPVIGPPPVVRCRYTIPGEVRYVLSRWKDPQLTWPAKISSAIEFLLLSLNPKIHSDLWFSGDVKLYWNQFEGFIKEVF